MLSQETADKISENCLGRYSRLDQALVRGSTRGNALGYNKL